MPAFGPNVTQFLRELHQSPKTDASPETYNLDDMSMFTNTEFFDFDTGQNVDFQPQPTKPDAEGLSSSADGRTAGSTELDGFSNIDFIGGDFGFSDFNNGYNPPPPMSNFQDNLASLQPIQPNPQTVYGAVPQQQHQHQHPPAPNGYGPPPPRIGDKRRSETASPTRPGSFEDQTRQAAEEDKRRRNTAASARFRIKKKQREQALEKSAKDLGEKVTALEGRIQQLETENKWLKNIVLEKNGGNEEFLAKLLEDCNAKTQAELKKEDGAGPSDLKASASTEEGEAGDSSG